MLGLIRKKANNTRAYSADVVKVQGGLAISPSQMSQLTERGIPISSQVLGAENFYDGDVGPLSDVPVEFRRGVDISEIYEYQQRSRQKVNDYVKSQKSE